ncbi:MULTISPECIES: MarR family winged helix-turn-helix transcriptional regulator [unclassified Sphingobium]|uniref:MarR family winged helix-turn-helix transcriptional regulator n=1 Tax=unclassified Sphingobium TaxID=2611147 RepID=UPI002224A87A|nr:MULTISPECIES: MarR family transcriptional regulator [unclassified Sphingobium]MCW2410719.1 MarR family transcriptional regulator for hemolysin [Sphingobium sp. B8D3D]MCW2416991.1 MarR family transcriptional regulator for hemolysin [Sphingobium sp. B8D3A]
MTPEEFKPAPSEDQPSHHQGYSSGDARDEVEFELTRLLSLSARRWGTYVESRMMPATGQSRSRWQTLYVLSVAPPPVTTSHLSARLAIQWPPLIRTLNSLEKDGLIRRIDNPADKRSRYIEITPAGLDVVAQVQPALSQFRSRAFTQLTTEEMNIATRILEKIIQGVSDAQCEP